MSIGEGRIINILNHAGIRFETEKTFGDLKHGLYRFDFYLPSYNGGPVVAEYNGQQHYEQVKKFHKTRKEFTAAQERDRRKISYCLANGITIYCIPYWDGEKIKTIDDIFKPEYIAHNRWKNDEDWRAHKGKGEGK